MTPPRRGSLPRTRGSPPRWPRHGHTSGSGAALARAFDDSGARNAARRQMPRRRWNLVERIRIDEDERWHLERRENRADVRLEVARELSGKAAGRYRCTRVAGEPFTLRSSRRVTPLERAPGLAAEPDLFLPAFHLRNQ